MTVPTPASRLTIDLDAVVANWRHVVETHQASCGAAVKADAYGTGVAKVAPALAGAGCRVFFVATLDEGVALRAILPDLGVTIVVLNGLMAGTEDVFEAHGLVPAINDLDQVGRIGTLCADRGRPVEAVLHIDTGMNRLGLSPKEVDWLAENGEALEGPAWLWVMTHLACADEPSHPMNEAQRRDFAAARARIRPMPVSFAASSGVFLGEGWRSDLARPGYALYGGRPSPERPDEMRTAVRLASPILQVREIGAGATVGYGAGYTLQRDSRIATIALGYADGWVRSISTFTRPNGAPGGSVRLGEQRLPMIGRVSMDLITVDVTDAPQSVAHPGAFVEVLGDDFTIDDAADAAGTIGYEFLTSLGARFHRTYLGGHG